MWSMTANDCSGFSQGAEADLVVTHCRVFLIPAVLLEIPAQSISQTLRKVFGFTGSVFDEMSCLRFQSAYD